MVSGQFPELRLQATHHFLKSLLLLALGSIHAVEEFIHRIYYTRHLDGGPFKWIGRAGKGRDPSFAATPSSEYPTSRGQDNHRGAARVGLACRLGLGDAGLRHDLEERARESYVTWKEMHGSIRELALADFVEETSYLMLGLEGAVQMLGAGGCFDFAGRAAQVCCTKGGDGMNCNLDCARP